MKRKAKTKSTPVPMLRVYPGSIPWKAWMDHYRRDGFSNWVRYCEGQGYAVVPSVLPPQISPYTENKP